MDATRTLTTEVCAYCRTALVDADPKRCGLRQVRPGTDPHRFETITMDPRIRDVAFDLSTNPLAFGGGFRGNFWNGADITGSNLRLTAEDGYEGGVTLLVFDDISLGILDYKVTFSADAPTAVISACATAVATRRS